ncbi:hypothetical protein RN001_006552 [Aquatica leii]|uniref:Major facilitator superfamily (MFS) profile domain-containing protein n=1 Tax=Aquatica leii TaxID=1421715 RepID=A0AAN7QL19_9COLE|nr:hypothetical protein RN001_006552 [Aquatica leii]
METKTESDKINKEKLQSYGTNNNDDNGVKFRISNTGDVLENTIGEFGRWQCQISILMSLLLLPMSWIQLGMVFLAPPTEFTCKGPPSLIPKLNEIVGGKSLIQPGSCLIKDPTSKKGDAMIPCPWGFDYDKSITNSSIISEWNLVCDREHLLETAQLATVLGVIAGGVLLGAAADKFGRKTVLSFSILLQTICGFVSAAIPWYYGFVTSQFLLSFANGGTMTTSFVMCVEIVGCQWRTITPILYHISTGIGSALMAALAYYLKDWRQLEFGLSILSSLYLSYLWLVPESPRWLLAVGRRREATEILDSATQTNGSSKNSIIKILHEWSRLNDTTNSTSSGLLSFITKGKFLKPVFLLGINCFISDLCFYGFAQYFSQFFNNIYVSVALQGLLYSISGMVAVVVINRNGRRQSITISSCFTGICFFALLMVSALDWVHLMVATIALVGMAVSHTVLYLLSAELFPTVMRSSAVGICIMFSKCGAILASVAINFVDVEWYVPLLCLGWLSFLQAILAYPLPETHNHELPDNADEVQEKGKSVE